MFGSSADRVFGGGGQGGDAQVHAVASETFDVALTGLGSMYFSDQVGAFTNIGRALRPEGGLAASGYDDIRIEPVDAPIYLGNDTDDAFAVLGPLLGSPNNRFAVI